MKIGFYWLVSFIVILTGALLTQGSWPYAEKHQDTLVQQHLNLLTELVRKDTELAISQLTQMQLAGLVPTSNLDAIGQFPLLGFAIRQSGSFIYSQGHIPLASRLPLSLEALNWLCLPDCHLMLSAGTSQSQYLAVVNLEGLITDYSRHYQPGVALSDSMHLKQEEPSQMDMAQTPFEQNLNWIKAEQPLFTAVPLTLTAKSTSDGADVVSQERLTAIWGIVLLLQCVGAGLYWFQQRRNQSFFQLLTDATSHIIKGESSKVHEHLSLAYRSSPKNGGGLLRKIALLGLQDESTRATLNKASHEYLWLEQHDKLTGLANRQQFKKNIEQLLVDKNVALLLIDIDDLKEINDASGQQVGNEMLLKLSKLLQSQVPQPHLLGRMAGDEFAAAIQVSEFSECEALAERLLDASKHVMLSGRTMLHRLSLSIGVVISPDHGNDFDTLMTRADVALNYSKKQGKGRFSSLRDPELEDVLVKQRFMYSRVHSAIRDKKLALAFQPIIDMKSGLLSHSEILLRIREESGKYVSAYPMIQAAERHRDVGALDKWVLNQVLNYLMQCRREGRNIRLAINISGVTISDPQMTEEILQRIEFSGCGSNLIIEITESAALENVSRVQRDISRLQELGCRVALDDFGIGYSSVNSLLNLPFDYVKVDGCFIKKIGEDEAIAPLLEFLVSISNLRGFQIIAEYVETQDIARKLQLLGVQFAQGYYFGAPVLLLRGNADDPNRVLPEELLTPVNYPRLGGTV